MALQYGAGSPSTQWDLYVMREIQLHKQPWYHPKTGPNQKELDKLSADLAKELNHSLLRGWATSSTTTEPLLARFSDLENYFNY